MKLSKNVQKLLKEGETVTASLQGNSYTTDSNPLARLMAAVVRIIALITGSPTRTTIICTNKRLIIETVKPRKLHIFKGNTEKAKI